MQMCPEIIYILNSCFTCVLIFLVSSVHYHYILLPCVKKKLSLCFMVMVADPLVPRPFLAEMLHFGNAYFAKNRSCSGESNHIILQRF